MRLHHKLAATVAAAGALLGFGVATGVGVGTASATSFVCAHLSSDPSGDACPHQTTLGIDHAYTTNQSLWTRDEKITVQNDGNLVQYCLNSGWSYGLNKWVSAGTPVWATGTNKWNAVGGKLVFWHDGNLAHYGDWQQLNGSVAEGNDWQSASWSPNAWAILQADGNLVIWSNGRAVWANNTYHFCPGTEHYWNGYQ
ncbi:hypothetical protein ACFW1F_17825 [Streptomyces bungoensis]|uniref:hypothetical protein n=1 Tax=Streptomyces bungoensis TaxID=285568 RepID=UPI00343E9402